MLNAEQIKAAREPPAGIVKVPEWGGEVSVRRLTAAEVEELRTWDFTADDVAANFRFLHWVLCDERGERLFTRKATAEEEIAEARAVFADRAYTVLLRIAEEAMRLNTLTKESREELRKNSAAVPT